MTDIETHLNRFMENMKQIPPEEWERRRKEDEASKERQSFDLFKAAKCPARHMNATNLNRYGAWGKHEQSLCSKLGSGFLTALIGTRGGGKTQLAVEVIRANSRRFRHSRLCTAMEFFMEIKASYQSDKLTEKQVVDLFCKPSLLVVDEIGKRSETEWENRLLYELINRRYNDLKDTLLISNQESAELEAALGPSIVSRMNETGGIVKCNWESYRK